MYVCHIVEANILWHWNFCGLWINFYRIQFRVMLQVSKADTHCGRSWESWDSAQVSCHSGRYDFLKGIWVPSDGQEECLYFHAILGGDFTFPIFSHWYLSLQSTPSLRSCVFTKPSSSIATYRGIVLTTIVLMDRRWCTQCMNSYPILQVT